MNKQEMAEWLAKEVLGWNRYENEHGAWWTNSVNNNILPREVESFIYSPDGFFAVWDALEKRNADLEINFILTAHKTPCCEIGYYEEIKWSGHGKDRYEAFYNAVKKAWGKGETE